MNDTEILHLIEKKIGRGFPHRIENGCCVELSLTSDDCLYLGLIRHHSASEKADVLRLIGNLRALRSLNLRRNRLFEIGKALTYLTQLEHLDLGSNYLGCVPPEIQTLGQLRSLNLGNNDLVELPVWFKTLGSLERLLLHKNLKLKSIREISGLKRLHTLNLYFLNLHELPEFVYGFENLVTLTLWNVSRFPDGLESLENLEFFTTCGTPGLRELPKGFTQLKRLRMTRLFQNNLERLPDDIGNLRNLEQISLYQNQLSSLPDSGACLSNLEKINLGWNFFQRLPSWLNELPRLRWLGLFENPIEKDSVVPFLRNGRVDREWPFTTVLENQKLMSKSQIRRGFVYGGDAACDGARK